MLESREALSEAIALEGEVVEGIRVARAEQELGGPGLSLGLLRESIEKERESLNLLDEGVETLRQSLEQRRHALDQEVEIIDQILRELERSGHGGG